MPPRYDLVLSSWLPSAIYQLAQGDPNMEGFGWSFTVIGGLMAMLGGDRHRAVAEARDAGERKAES